MTDTSFRTSLDTVKIEYEYDTLTYTKEQFNEIADNFPGLHEEYSRNPDLVYYSGSVKDITDISGKQKHLTFGSEIGQDRFYMLYAYFLKQKNKSKDDDEMRNKFIDAAHRINDIFGLLNYGGTFYGHQHKRIYGYAEYWVDGYKDWEKSWSNDFRNVSLTKQKELFFLSLRQQITDMVTNDIYLLHKNDAKRKKIKSIFEQVEKLNSLISNYFMLLRIQEFRYSYYQ
jgi:hypothetical protein